VVMALRHLTDEDLIAVGNSYGNDLSYYVAGWDYPESAARERAAHSRCRRKALPVHEELKRRGLRTDAPLLVSLGTGSGTP